MTKLNMYLDKNIYIIIILSIVLNPICDCLTSLSINILKLDISFGMIFKSFFLILYLYYYFFILKKKKKMLSIFLFAIIFYFIIKFFLSLSSNGSLLSEMSFLIKTFYFPLLLILLYSISLNRKIKIDDKYIVYMVFTYTLLILIPYFTKTSFNSYEVSKQGSVGWFNSANEVGNIIAITLPIIVNYVLNKISIKKIIMFFLIVLSIIIIGTKTPFISLGIIIIYYLIKYLIKIIKSRNNKKIILNLGCLLLFFLLIIILIPRTPIYKNIMIHLDYLKIKKITDLFNLKIFDHFFLGERLTFLAHNYNVYINGSFLSILFGMGLSIYGKLVEMDFFDLFLRFGLVGFLIYIIPCIYILRTNKKHNNKYLIPLILSLLIVSIVGHVLLKPSVSLILCILLINYLEEGINDDEI